MPINNVIFTAAFDEVAHRHFGSGDMLEIFRDCLQNPENIPNNSALLPIKAAMIKAITAMGSDAGYTDAVCAVALPKVSSSGPDFKKKVGDVLTAFTKLP